MNKNIYYTNNLEVIKNMSQNKNIVFKIPLCESKECGHELEKQLNLNVLGREILNLDNINSNCIICKKEIKYKSYLAKKY